ncbi:MAG: four helix bundle protein [Cyclobacteriaceae bacterium]
MDKFELQRRTQHLGIKTILFCRKLANDTEYKIIKNQLIRCATSVGANYRAACRAKSKADFIYKLKIVEEECDETIFFLEVLGGVSQILPAEKEFLMEESKEILAIITSSLKTLRKS